MWHDAYFKIVFIKKNEIEDGVKNLPQLSKRQSVNVLSGNLENIRIFVQKKIL